MPKNGFINVQYLPQHGVHMLNVCYIILIAKKRE